MGGSSQSLSVGTQGFGEIDPDRLAGRLLELAKQQDVEDVKTFARSLNFQLFQAVDSKIDASEGA